MNSGMKRHVMLAKRLLKFFHRYRKRVLSREQGIARSDNVVALERQSSSAHDARTLRVAIAEGGGFGDCLLQATMAKEIYKLLNGDLSLTFLTRFPSFFSRFPYIHRSLPYVNDHDVNSYDVYLIGHRFYIVCRIDEAAVLEHSDIFHTFLIDQQNLLNNVFQGEFDDLRCNEYALLFGRNRIEQLDVHGILGVSRFTRNFVPLYDADYQSYEELGLISGKYITVSRAADAIYGDSHPKIWPAQRYEATIYSIRCKYPDIRIVQVGASEAFGALKGVDVNLLGKLTLQQTAVVIKNAALHLDSEGGLVHLARFVGGRSVVVFGPTSPTIYAYSNNKNLSGDGCPIHCEWISPGWTEGCLRGFKVAPCIDSVGSKDVEEAILSILLARKRSEYSILSYDKSLDMLSVTEGPEALITGNDMVSDLQGPYSGQESVIFLCTDQPEQKAKLRSTMLDGMRSKIEFCTILSIPAEDSEFNLVRLSYPLPKESSLLSHSLTELLRIVANQGCLVIENGDIQAVTAALALQGVPVQVSAASHNDRFVIKKALAR